MKKILISLIALAIMFGITVSAQARICNHGNGLMYNDCANINLLQEGNYAHATMTCQENVNWTHNLQSQGYDDYRLPAILHQDSFGPASYSNIISEGSEVKRTSLTSTVGKTQSTSLPEQLSEQTTRLVLFMLLTGQSASELQN
jgi:hypothetical protein